MQRRTRRLYPGDLGLAVLEGFSADVNNGRSQVGPLDLLRVAFQETSLTPGASEHLHTHFVYFLRSQKSERGGGGGLLKIEANTPKKKSKKPRLSVQIASLARPTPTIECPLETMVQ